jgi:hypothetical protein
LSRRFVPLSSEIADDWDDLVAGSPDGWVFSLAPWQRLILAVEPWGLRDHSFAYYENGRLASVMPLQFSPHSHRMSSSGWGGSGPVLAGDLSPVARERVLRVTLEYAGAIARQAGAQFLDMAISPVTRSSVSSRWGVNPFVFYGFSDVSQISQVIDLSPSEDDLFGAVSPKTQPLLRRALKEGIEVRRIDWREFLDAYYVCHCETYTRTGVSPHPKAYFAGIANDIAPRGHAVLLAAFTRTGEAIAFHNSARFGEGALYHTGCSREQALEIGANHLLLWRSILSAKQDGMRWFDVGTIIPGTADPKLKGLTLFKTRFGGEPHRYLRCEMALLAAAPQKLAPVASSLQEAGEPEILVDAEQAGRRGLRWRIRRTVRRVLGRERKW